MSKPSTLVILSTAAGLIALVAIYTPGLELLAKIVLTFIAIAAPLVIRWLEQRAARTDNLNGHLVRLIDALKATREIIEDATFDDMPDPIQDRLYLIEDRIGNLATRMQGWRELDEARARVIAAYEQENGEQAD